MTDEVLRTTRRERSHEQVLSVLRTAGPATRTGLVARTGLSASAIAGITRSLLDAGLIEEEMVVEPSRGRGRPSARLSMSRPSSMVAAIDFGHNHVRVALSRSDTVLTEASLRIDVDHLPVEAMDLAAAEVRQLLSDVGADLSDVTVVAAGVPAPIDRKSNVIEAVNVLPAWIGFNPRDQLAVRLGRPTIIRNDAEMGALGELYFGAAMGEKDFLYVKASHGIGACLVLGGRVYRGHRGAAGELGHVQLAGMDNFCRCGKRGCVEAVLGSAQIEQQLSYVLRDEPVGGDAVTIMRAANTPAGARVLADAGRSLGRLLADVCMILDPAAIIIGGSLGAAGNPLLDGVREAISRFTGDTTGSSVSVRAAALGDRAELMGAVATATNASADAPTA